MKQYRSLQWLWWVALGLVAAGACGEGGVVGGDCLPGFIVCEGSCVNPHVHARNCGACGNGCADGEICDDGECGPGGAGAGGESGSAGAAGEDGSSGGTNGGSSAVGGNSAMGGSGGFGTGGFGTGGLGTGGGTGGDGVGGGSGGDGVGGGSGGDGVGGGSGGDGVGGGSGGGSVCLPPFDSPEACGDCNTQCILGTPLCSPTEDGGFECVRRCGRGLTNCYGRCVDRETDPRNCGECGNVCASGLCVSGTCVGTTPGHVVYICMNYAEAFQQSSQITLLGNAVLLPAPSTVRVLAYSGHARSAIMTATDRAIRWAATSEGRDAEITRSSDLDQIETDLVISNYEVFLVYDQAAASSGELAAAGTQLSDTLNAFTIGGGIVVILSGAVGVGEMNEFATAAGLAAIGQETQFTSLAYVRANADVIGVNVVSPFQTLDNSCTFATSETPSADTFFVVTDTPPGSATGAPIVLHKVVAP